MKLLMGDTSLASFSGGRRGEREEGRIKNGNRKERKKMGRREEKKIVEIKQRE